MFRGKIRECLNNSAITVAESVEDVQTWNKGEVYLTPTDFATFLGLKYIDIERFTTIDEFRTSIFLHSQDSNSKNLSQRESSVSEVSNPFPRPHLNTHIRESLHHNPSLIKRSRSINNKKNTQDEEKTVDRVIWDCTEIAHPLKSTERKAMKRLQQRRERQVNSCRFDWWAEVLVYAKLGYWAPDLLPKVFQEKDSISDSELSSRTSQPVNANRGLNPALQPSLQMNPTKQFLHKFGGSQGFYRSLRKGYVNYEDLYLAILLCQFGISLGLKRSMKSFEESKLRQIRNHRLSAHAFNVSMLNRLLDSHSRRLSRASSIYEMKGIVNRLVLIELNAIKEHSEYQSIVEHVPQDESKILPVYADLNLPDESEGLSVISDLTDISTSTDLGDLVESVLHKPTERLSESSTKSGVESVFEDSRRCTLDHSDARSIETVAVSERSAGSYSKSHRSFSKHTADLHSEMQGPQKIGSQKTEKKSIQLHVSSTRPSIISVDACKSTQTDSVSRKSDMSSNQKTKRTISSGIHKYRLNHKRRNSLALVPDWKYEIPTSTPLRTMLETRATNYKFPKSKLNITCADNTARKIMEFTARRQPLVARVLRESYLDFLTNSEKTLTKATKVMSVQMEPVNKTNRFMLPAIAPSKPSTEASSALADECELPISLSRISCAPKTSRSDILCDDVNILKQYPKKPAAMSSVSNSDKLNPCSNAVSNKPNHSITKVGGWEPGQFVKTGPSLLQESKLKEKRELQEHLHLFLVPRLTPKPLSLLHAVNQELYSAHPFVLEYFTRVLEQIIPEHCWMAEHSSSKLIPALERLGADLLIYRHSSGHTIRLKVMSILAASAHNRALRKQLKRSAVMQGNWLDQLLRTLASDTPTCRTEAAVALAKLATEPRLMKQLLREQKLNVIPDIFDSLLRAADYHPDSWPEYYMAMAFFIQHNQCQLVCDSLIDRGVQCGLSNAGSCWLRLLAYIYTYWQQSTLKSIILNEKRMSHLMNTALNYPPTKRAASEAIAALSEYHMINVHLFSMWRAGSQSGSHGATSFLDV
ncbi:hypothetical protein EG68_10513 [Paragonimus skrjabini miyazakii]|uniref:Uncharacterized protein n=1 Tax=Paragonimus skrjabini miyazakii TaxID=59628 RepID=A0A8S9YIP6_9TREM|nr:hypothetical protein EG68_10513 [Paragonimus skrjabini miyazakii]